MSNLDFGDLSSADRPATEPRTEVTRLREEAELLERMRHDPKVSVRKYAARACGSDWAAFARVLAAAEAAQGAASRAAECCGHEPHGDDPCQATVSDWGDSYTGIPCPCDGRAAPRAEGLDAAFDLLHAIMDSGFRSGERYVHADELTFILGRPFTFENEDGSTTTFDGKASWLADYPYPNNDIGLALARLSRPSDERVPESEEPR